VPTSPALVERVDVIELRELTFYGYHGALAEEQRLGQRFIVDVRLGLGLEAAGRSDELAQTVNYAKVAETIQTIVEGRPFKLIEALAEAIAARILEGYTLVDEVYVRIAKPSAPIATVPSGLVAVEITRGRQERQPGMNLERAGRARTGEGGERAMSVSQGDTVIPPGGSVLTAASIRALLDHEPPLVEPLGDPDAQIQPNGIDLTLESVWRLDGTGAIALTNADRVIPDREAVEPSVDGWFDLGPGTYMIRLAETVALPLDLMAFGRPRSSLLRCGAALHTAVWDAGYQGRSESLLVVYAEGGVRLARGARVLQLVFIRLVSATHAYDGVYQGENSPPQ
jgi:dUTP pyrophosphatase